jgi:hypothetical protein
VRHRREQTGVAFVVIMEFQISGGSEALSPAPYRNEFLTNELVSDVKKIVDISINLLGGHPTIRKVEGITS